DKIVCDRRIIGPRRPADNPLRIDEALYPRGRPPDCRGAERFGGRVRTLLSRNVLQIRQDPRVRALRVGRCDALLAHGTNTGPAGHQTRNLGVRDIRMAGPITVEGCRHVNIPESVAVRSDSRYRRTRIAFSVVQGDALRLRFDRQVRSRTGWRLLWPGDILKKPIPRPSVNEE